MEYNWKTKEYIELIKKPTNQFLKKYIDVELDYITNRIADSDKKTFIDVGAGYGRVIPALSKIAKKVIAVENNKEMLSEIKKKEFANNVLIVECDAQELSDNLKDINIENPVVICLQNSLGTPYGDPYKIIGEMVKVAKDNQGELIISLYIQERLRDCGVSIYKSSIGLVGEIDFEKTDFEKGNFVSKIGYRSHWWTKDERRAIIEAAGGNLIAEILEGCFHIFHIKY